MKQIRPHILFFIFFISTFVTSGAFSNTQETTRRWVQSDDNEFVEWFSKDEFYRHSYINQGCPYKPFSLDCTELIYQAKIVYSFKSNIDAKSFAPSKKLGMLLQKIFSQYTKFYNKYISTKETTASTIDYSVRPFFLYDLFNITRIFNLTQHSSEFQNNEIEFNRFEKGFIVQKYFQLSLGLGANTGFSFSNVQGLQSLVNFSIGLMPIKERTTLFSYYVPKKEDLRVEKRHIPFNADKLKNWNIGDNVFYQSSGGAVFLASAGIPFLSVGATITLEGSWNYYLEKLDDHKVFINATRVTTKSAMAFLGTVALSIGENFLKNNGIGFSYEVDLSNEQAAMAYKDMLKGNIVPMQEMANDDRNFSVINVENQNSKFMGKAKILSLGFPLVKLTSSKGNYYSLSQSHYLDGGLKVENEYGIYSREVFGMLLTRHKNRIKSFYGGVTKISNAKNELLSLDNKIQFSWNFEKDHFKSHSFNKAINEIIQDTGLNFLKIKSFETENLGYARINLKVDADAQFTNALTGANRSIIFENIQNDLFTNIDNYFEGSDIYNLCHMEKLIRSCKSHYKAESKNALDKIIELTADLKYQIGKNNKEFAQSYAKIGELSWKNPFLFKAIFEQMKKCGSTLSYEVSGEKISQYRLKLETPLDPKVCY
jgi:hypothetical protein